MTETLELSKSDSEIALKIKAKYPIISIVSYEEWRVLEQLEGVAADVRKYYQTLLQEQRMGTDDDDRTARLKEETLAKAYQIVRWSYTKGLEHWSYPHGPIPLDVPGGIKDAHNPVDVIRYLCTFPKEIVLGVDMRTAIFVFSDLHTWLDRNDSRGRFNHMIVRAFRDLAYGLQYSEEPRSVLLISPQRVVPMELSKEIQIIEYPLPTATELEQHFEGLVPNIIERHGTDSIKLSPEGKSRLISAQRGLIRDEAANVIARSLAANRLLSDEGIEQVLDEKRQIIHKDGMLDYIEQVRGFRDVGGLELLRRWLALRSKAFLGKKIICNGREIHLPTPKGVLLIGVPGSGKSLMAQAVASEWNLPLLRLDAGRIYGGLVGQSEENMRRAIRTAESVSPAVMWIDEIEKAFPRSSGSTDSGVSLRVMGTFLTWMQEKTAQVFVVATGNDISLVPPELTRKGRFDEIFYVGLPGMSSRQKIFHIHLEARGLQLAEAQYQELAELTPEFTGAEIEQIVLNALFYLFGLEEKVPPYDHSLDELMEALKFAVGDLVPLAEQTDDQGNRILSQMLDKARRIATPASKDFEELKVQGGVAPPAVPQGGVAPPGIKKQRF